MGSEASNSKSQAAVRGNGENGSIGAGPEEFPRNEEFENEGSYGNPFGDRKPREPEREGADLSAGLSCRIPFGSGGSPDREEEQVTDLGLGRDESTGKPDGPEKGKVDNHGASSKQVWG